VVQCVAQINLQRASRRKAVRGAPWNMETSKRARVGPTLRQKAAKIGVTNKRARYPRPKLLEMA
jgi:hypothetical protein